MRVLVALTYFRPHVSGLTIYVERLVAALAERGHEVTVLTSHYDPKLPRDEISHGVRIVRVPVAMKVSKGVLMPSLGYWATRLVREHDVVSLHLPQFDAAGIAARGRLFKKPTVLTYHCDLQLPSGLFNRAVDQAVFLANYVSGVCADRVVAYTRDYADHSRLLRRFGRKLVVIPPPVVMPSPTPEQVAAFRAAHCLNGRPVIGYASRFATEKGIEYLIDAMPALLARFPTLKVLFAGPYRDVIGEETYRARLEPRIAELGDHWEFLGTLKPEQLPPFYGALDSLLVTSVNSTESFGLVQVEAMLCGTPVVVSDLPGVRQPVRTTGMGVVVPVANAAALADGVTKVLGDKPSFVRPRAEVERAYDLDVTVSAYERLFADLIKSKR
jgi:glycosyltransferase involved in cell wall biosynthesis